MTEPLMERAELFSLMSTHFYDHLINAWNRSSGITVIREAEPRDRVESLIAGTLTGLLDVCFDAVEKENRDEIMRYLRDECLPAARSIVEEDEASMMKTEAFP